MKLRRHLKRRESRAPEAGIATAHGNEIVHLSPARRLSPVAGVCFCAALLIALLIGPVSEAQAETSTYNFVDVTTSNHGDGTYPIAIAHDSAVFPWTVAADQNDSVSSSDADYVDISADNTSELVTADAADEWILYKRGENADVYQNINDPDEFQVRIHTVPINYWDGEEFKPIDLAIKEVSDGDYKYEMSAAPYQVYFPESLNSPIKLMSQGKSYEFTLKEMSYNAGEDYLDSPQLTSAVIGDKKVIYPEAFENIDIEYTLRTWGIKEFFVLKEKPRAPADHLTNPTLDFTEIIDARDLKMYIDGVPAPDNFPTEKSIEFVDEASGETIFILPAPYAIDANEEIIQTRIPDTAAITKVELKLFIDEEDTPLNNPHCPSPIKFSYYPFEDCYLSI